MGYHAPQDLQEWIAAAAALRNAAAEGTGGVSELGGTRRAKPGVAPDPFGPLEAVYAWLPESARLPREGDGSIPYPISVRRAALLRAYDARPERLRPLVGFAREGLPGGGGAWGDDPDWWEREGRGAVSQAILTIAELVELGGPSLGMDGERRPPPVEGRPRARGERVGGELRPVLIRLGIDALEAEDELGHVQRAGATLLGALAPFDGRTELEGEAQRALRDALATRGDGLRSYIDSRLWRLPMDERP